MSSSKRCTAAWTSSIRCSTRAACSSTSVSRRRFRSAIRSSVSSRTRAISAFDHSRMPAMSASDWWRISSPAVADSAWISSTRAFALSENRVRDSSRAASAASRIARTRPTTSGFSRRVGVGTAIFAGSAGVASIGGWSAGVSLHGFGAGVGAVGPRARRERPGSAMPQSWCPWLRCWSRRSR